MKNKKTLLAIIIIAVIGCLYLSCIAGQSNNGRYQIVETKLDMFLLDTRNGETWRRVRIPTKDNNGLLTTYWSPDMRFFDGITEDAHVTRVKEATDKKASEEKK